MACCLNRRLKADSPDFSRSSELGFPKFADGADAGLLDTVPYNFTIPSASSPGA